MIVLSLFDGIACGCEALKRAGIPVTKYYASEIDPYAIKIAKKNHPEIIHLGDVTNWEEWDIEKPDLIIGGSPCQGFSFAGKQLAFNDPRSKLFFVMMDIIKHYKPRYKFLENVRMKKEYLDVIDYFMGVKGHLINSALVSAQNRQRYYWYNWSVKSFKNENIQPESIIDGEGFATKGVWGKKPRKITMIKTEKFGALTASYYKGLNSTLRPAVSVEEGVYTETRNSHRMLTPIECERIQTLPDNYTNGVSNTQRYKMLGNGWTVDMVVQILKGLKNENQE